MLAPLKLARLRLALLKFAPLCPLCCVTVRAPGRRDTRQCWVLKGRFDGEIANGKRGVWIELVSDPFGLLCSPESDRRRTRSFKKYKGKILAPSSHFGPRFSPREAIARPGVRSEHSSRAPKRTIFREI